MRRTFIAAATALSVLSPFAASAQATSEKMQGSPNANGMTKGDKADMPSSSGQGASDKMKGPPNANGATKDDSKKN